MASGLAIVTAAAATGGLVIGALNRWRPRGSGPDWQIGAMVDDQLTITNLRDHQVTNVEITLDGFAMFSGEQSRDVVGPHEALVFHLVSYDVMTQRATIEWDPPRGKRRSMTSGIARSKRKR